MGNDNSTVAGPDDTGDEQQRSYRDREDEEQGSDEIACEFGGFRVLGIQEQSPASSVGFVSFFDFIMSANGIRLDAKDSTLMELIAHSEEQPMELDVYNVKSQTLRKLSLTPSRNWPGKGLLGVTIRFDSHENTEDQLLHVLRVTTNSPAHVAGLRPGSDYLLGTPERAFRDPEDLYEVILEALDSSFQCYVYNCDDDQVRIVNIELTNTWGGEGVLGAEVGHGVLHRLPSACRSTVGSSIGFVSLSKEAKAATDPYLRESAPEPRVPVGDNVAEGVADEPERHGGHSEAPEDSSDPLPELPSADETIDVAGSEAQVGLEPTDQASREEAELPKATPPTPPSKLRYAARIDPRFPISTVEVLADPTQLR